MSTTGTTTASSAHANETGLTSPLSWSPTRIVSIISRPPTLEKQPLPNKGKHQVSEMKPVPPKWLQHRPPRRPYSSKELISIGNMPSNAQLKSMNSKPFISIRWKGSQGDEPIMLYESFPKALAIAFSDVCRQSKGSSVIIVGGVRLRVKKIFDFMLESAKGQGCAPPPIPEQLRYCTYVRGAVDASVADVPLLENEYEARRIMIEMMQVHSADVEQIYLDGTSKGQVVREDVARSIARKTVSKTLKAYLVYMQLRKELPEFDADVKKALRVFRKPLEEENRRSMREAQQQAQQQAWGQQQKEARQAQAARREKAAAVPRMETVSYAKAPPNRNLQPRTVEKVQTSLGIIWAAVPVNRDPEGKAPKDHTKKIAPPKKASEASENAAKHTDEKESVISWADEVAELSEMEGKAEKERVGGGPDRRQKA